MKIGVLGLGYSINEYKPEYDLTIGVNDIWKYVKSDIIVCLDKPSVFTYDRLKVINDSKPQAFYSQIVQWDTRPDFRKVDLLPGYPDNFVQFDTPALHKSYCSPFVAAEIAFKYYFADQIHLFGVDLLNHPSLDKVLCERIKIHFINLKRALTLNGIYLIVHGAGILKDI